MALLDDAKKLLGISDISRDDMLTYIGDLVSGQAQRYCCVPAAPDEMEPVLVSMVVERYRAAGYGQEQTPQQVSSVTVGNEAVSFQKPRNVPQSYILSSELTDGEKSMLRPWRKLWP
jgi:hypothetical protein